MVEMSEQDSGSMTTTNELCFSTVNGNGRNLEEASLVRSIMKPLVQIRVNNIFDAPT
jgi:hypothetical protein